MISMGGRAPIIGREGRQETCRQNTFCLPAFQGFTRWTFAKAVAYFLAYCIRTCILFSLEGKENKKCLMILY